MAARSTSRQATFSVGDDTSPCRADGPELANYIADMAGQLQQMAQRERLDFLAYLLDLARIEAGDCASDPAFWGEQDGEH